MRTVKIGVSLAALIALAVIMWSGMGGPLTSPRARIVGLHRVTADEPVHLVEIEVDDGVADFDFADVTQEAPGRPRENWQVAYDKQPVGKNRFAFWFHYLDSSRPLLSSLGPLALPSETPIPEHLRHLVYEPP